MYNYDRRAKVAASEIPLEELPDNLKALVKRLEKLPGGWEANTVWDGIHGYIVDFELSSMHHVRFAKQTLKDLVSESDIRWVEVSQGGTVAVGMRNS